MPKAFYPYPTRNDRILNLNDLKDADLDIKDIAYSLAHQYRFNGHFGQWSVARHSVLCAILMGAFNNDTRTRHLSFEGLMHDAHEAYIGDIHRSVSKVISPNRPLDGIREIEKLVRMRYHLEPQMTEICEAVDEMALVVEIKNLSPYTHEWVLSSDPRLRKHYEKWLWKKDVSPKIEAMVDDLFKPFKEGRAPTPKNDERLFLRMFDRLYAAPPF